MESGPAVVDGCQSVDTGESESEDDAPFHVSNGIEEIDVSQEAKQLANDAVVELLHGVPGARVELRDNEEMEQMFGEEGEFADGSSEYQIIGEQGASALDRAEEATVRMDNLRVAREMERAGKDAKTVRLATGWERGADGKWRYEIEDIELIPFKEKYNQLMPLSEYVKADGLFKAYPKLRDVGVETVSNLPNSILASFDKTRNRIVINNQANENEIREIIAHEIQHAIQEIEGFARGGNSAQFGEFFGDVNIGELKGMAEFAVTIPTDITRDELIAKYKTEEDKLKRSVYVEILGGIADGEYSVKDIIDLIVHDHKVMTEKLNKELSDKDSSYNKYLRLAGEVESRNVQLRRLDMTPEQRRETLLAETEDIAREDQIFLIENSGVSAMGSRVDGRMAEVGEHFNGSDLNEAEQSVVDVYSGKVNNVPLSISREDGNVRIIMRQGTENKAGTKHSLLRHYGTGVGVITAEDVTLIPRVLEEGTRKEVVKKGKKGYEYELDVNGTKFTVYTETGGKREEFCDFYSNKKGINTRSLNTQSSARSVDANTSSDGKVTNNSSNEQWNQQNTEQTNLMRKPNGVVYGAAKGRTIYLNREHLNANTGVHEYTHLWANAMMRKNPKGWSRIKDLLRGTPVWDEVLNDENYAGIRGNEDAVASEVLSRLSGRNGAERLEQMAERLLAEADGVFEKASAHSLIERIRSAIELKNP